MGRGRAIRSQGLVLLRLGDLAAAGRNLDRAIRIQRKGGLTSDLAWSRITRANLHLDEGQFRRALGMYVRSARTLRGLGKLDGEALALQNAGYAAGELGLWGLSRVLLDRAIVLGSSIGQWNTLSRAYACRSWVCAHERDFEGATVDLDRARRLLRGRRGWIEALHVLRARARLAVEIGNWEEAARLARGAERLAQRVGDVPRVMEFRKLRARAEGRLGRLRPSLFARKSAMRLESLRGLGPSAMRELTQVAHRLAAADLPILIVGENGTGKRELAREIHRVSARSKRPYVIVPCEQLVFPASELQGHRKGAWTGADRDSRGLVRGAEGGTLVFDRVDELSPADQRALLRIVQRRIRPVGSPTEEVVDVRVIATCRKAEHLVPALRDRLSGAVLRMPRLRERRSEIPALVRELLHGRREITSDALAELARHPWEGNSAELGTAIDRMVALSSHRIGRNHVRRVFMTPKSCRDGSRVYKKRASRRIASTPA